MKWNYKCPICGSNRMCDWEDRYKNIKCGNCNNQYTVPSPATNHDFYVDTHNWPIEMEEVVLNLKGKICSVPKCSKKMETLDHRIPYSKGGKTSVSNLFPMCNKHNQSKSNNEYSIWLSSNP